MTEQDFKTVFSGYVVKVEQDLQQLMDARNEYRLAAESLVTAEENLRFTNAQVEQKIINEAGGEKNLGSNQEARDRALTLAMVHDPGWCLVVEGTRQLQAKVKWLATKVENAESRFKASVVILAALSGTRT